MEYQIIEDWRVWSKIGVMPKRPHCTLNQSPERRYLSPCFSEDDLLRFDRTVAKLAKVYPLNAEMFKQRYLQGMTYTMIAQNSRITPQRARKMVEFFISQTVNMT